MALYAGRPDLFHPSETEAGQERTGGAEVMDLTKAQERAIKWLSERGGSGVLDRYGRLIAGGEVASQFHPTTWVRLVAKGAVRGGGGRLSVVDAP